MSGYNFRPRLRWSIAMTATAALAVFVLLPMPAGAGDSAPGFSKGRLCSATADAARIACASEVKDDFWIGIGNCANIADPFARFTCREEAGLARAEGREQCAEQFAARRTLCGAIGEAAYDPVLDPADFLSAGELLAALTPNPYFPLVPGTVYRYVGGDETIEVTVTNEIKVISGIPAIVVHDIVTELGDVIEDTFDWYAQDLAGNVWYLGEISQQFEDTELVGIEGSWKAYRDFAKPGIIMHAAPTIGQVYRQEFSLGNAEDVAEVISLAGTAHVAGASCDANCLVTMDYTPIEPGVAENKYYAPGVGMILEINPATGERVELVNVTP